MRTREQIRKDVATLRSRRSYRTAVVTMRILILALLMFAAGWQLQYTIVPKQIVGVILVGSFVVGFSSGLVYFVAILYLAVERSLKARSVYNPTASLEFAKVYLLDLVRPILYWRRRRTAEREPRRSD